MPMMLQQIGMWMVLFGLLFGVGGCSVHAMTGDAGLAAVCGWIAVVSGVICLACGLVIAELRAANDRSPPSREGPERLGG